MEYIADLHIHSKYSRATSRDMDLEHLAETAQRKGIQVLATGDFTHPAWFLELKNKLEPQEPGFFVLKDNADKNIGNRTRFVLSVEISCIYSKAGKVRRIHILVLAPSLETAAKINAHLGVRGNLKADGRPILGLDVKELTKIVLNVNPECMIIPGHIWTPWFALFGSKSGFNTIEECFEEYTPYIFAVETGLSSDPAMNWRLSALDRMAIISNSDSHSLQKLGREANVLDTELSYLGLMQALKTKNPKQFLSTVEFFPQEGKYHYDGHRLCGVCFSPQETKKHQGLCPKCQKPLVVGVLSRVEELADRPEGFKPQGAIPFKNIIPLDELIAQALGAGVASKAVKKEYDNLLQRFASEFFILLKASQDELKTAVRPETCEAILRMRSTQVHIEPGYDGEYGKIKIFSDGERNKINTQKSLF
jgi:uncharacterized protein (TIGR00375 family)